MSAVKWGTIEDAVHAWVVAGSGLAADHVIWAAQNSPAPSSPYISLRLSVVRSIGYDWLDVENNPSPQPGAEVINRVRGMRRLTLAMRCDAATATGTRCPQAILDDVIASASLPSIGDALGAVVGLGNIGDVHASDGVVDSMLLEPLALVDVQLYATAELSETGTYIEFAQIGGTPTTVSGAAMPEQTFQVGT